MHSTAPRIIEVLWKPPPLGWIKVNTDGAAFGCPSLTGYGGIFCNCKGFVHRCFAIPIGLAFAFEVELVATIQAISFAWDRNWKKLWLETDSMYLASVSEQIIGGSLEVASCLGVMFRLNFPNGVTR